MPFGEDSAAMGLQVGFKGVGFFAVIKCNRIFDTPRAEFCGMWDVAFIVFLKAGFQIFCNSGITVRFRRNIDQQVHIVEFCHADILHSV